MKTINILTSTIALLAISTSSQAQENLVINGSFEQTHGHVRSPGVYFLADSISSANNTTVDLYSNESKGIYYSVPTNYMGEQLTKKNNNYAGILAYYADETGIFNAKPGYQKYSEYIQLAFVQPLEAGKVYAINFDASLSEQSDYAVSGLGVYISNSKTDLKNNSFLNIIPQFVCADIVANKDWTTLGGTYVAKGGERYITLGCFNRFMETKKITEPNTNNSRKAYYYIDEVGVSLVPAKPDEMTGILSGSCFKLNNLNFETNKSVILENSYAELKSLAVFLKTYPYITVFIDGHTDVTGSNQHNDQLSEDRAMAVKAYLVLAGIEKDRLKARGYGENYPIDTQTENNLENRRVEITVCATK